MVRLECRRLLLVSHHASGNFCKHLVAVGLAVLDASPPHPAEFGGNGGVDPILEGLDRAALVDLVQTLIDRDPSARMVVLARAAAQGSTEALDDADLVSQVNDALQTRGFVDYRRSFEVARDAEEVLDRMAEILTAGAADAVRAALLRALTRLRKITEYGDDSAGVLGGACQRAADLYARCCREGNPDPVPLARWLIKFRRDSPGWPETPLEDFVDAFDDKALRTYRKAAEKWSAEPGGAGRRFDIDRVLLELADHDGDLDLAIQILSRDDKSVEYGEIIQRLSAAGRKDDALRWLDKAVESRRISGYAGPVGNAYWVAPAQAADLYLTADRPDDAVAVLRAEFARSPGPESWRALLALGARLGRETEERSWALASVEAAAQEPFSSGAALVEIGLAEDRLDDAWSAAERFGAGHAWERLAKASAHCRPVAAAELCRPSVEKLLVYANSSVYPEIAKKLAAMRDLYASAGDDDTFRAYVGEIRGKYARRPSLMKSRDKRGL